MGVLTRPLGGLAVGDRVALKRPHPTLADDPVVRATFENEASAGRAVRDPSLVRVLAAGADAEGPWLAMEYVEGRSLREALDEEGPLPEPLVRRMGAQVAGALAALHGAGLCHGDVKPENIRLDPGGRAVLVDLGFARQRDAAGEGPAAGSLPYLAPERAQGGPAAAAGDVYALGLVLWEVAVGAHPVLSELGAASGATERATSVAPLVRALEVDDADRLLAALATPRIPAPSRAAPVLSPLFDEVVGASLALDPADRASATRLAGVLSEGEAGEWWRERVERAGDPTPRRRAHLTPLVGRREELERIQELWRRARAGEGGAALVLGPAGAGHTRLVRAFADAARRSASPPTILTTRCSDVVESRPHGAALRLLRRWLQLPDDQPAAGRERERLERLVAPEIVETLVGALDPRLRDELEGSVSTALAQWLHALAAEQPVVVFIDDLRHAQALSLRSFGQIARGLGSAPLLMIGALREDDPADDPEALELFLDHLDRLAAEPDGPRVERIELGPLTADDVRALVDQLFHRTSPRLRLAEELWRRSRGNAGALAEVLRELLDRGDARRGDDGLLRLETMPDSLPRPATQATAIARRLASLEPADRLWLERLAVVGGRLDSALLVNAFPPTTAAEMAEVLARLARAGWLAPTEGWYRFTRSALREAVYTATAPDRRRRLHTAVARNLAPHSTEDGGVDAFLRAHHLRAAGDRAALLALLDEQLPLLLDLGQSHRVGLLARWGLEALQSAPSGPTADEEAERELRLLEAAADAANRLGRREEERRTLDRMAALGLDPSERPADVARIYLQHGRYAAGTGQYGLARGMYRNASELAHKSGDALLESECLRRLSLVQSHVGELLEARELARDAVRCAAGPVQLALAWLARGVVEILDDRLEVAMRASSRAFRLLRTSTAPPGVLAAAVLVRARALRAGGRPARALGTLGRALRLARRSGQRHLEAEVGARLGGLLLDVDRPDEAEARLRDALLTAEEIEDRRGRTLAQVWLGILLTEREDPEAQPLLGNAIEVARDMGFYRAEAVAQAISARIDRARGDLDAALERSRRASELLDRHGSELLDRIVIAATRGLVLESAGRKSEARSHVRALRRRVRSDSERIRDEELRRDQRRYATRLLEAALSPDGPIYPRARLE
jgi:tetratricopeptide (TPR) repeat protein